MCELAAAAWPPAASELLTRRPAPLWIQHPQLGAFSIVLADDLATGAPDPETLMIRARCREHLDLLQLAHPALSEYPVLESDPFLDYRFRLIAPKAVAATALAEVVQAMDYRNVKDCAHRHEAQVGAPFAKALHRIWETLRRIQPSA